MLKRIIFDAILLLGVFFSPWWWLSVISVMLFIIIFPRFWESILFGILMDSINGPSSIAFFGGLNNWIFTLFFLIFFFALVGFKKHLSFYK